MFGFFNNLFQTELAIDAGSTMTRISTPEKGVVLEEPSVIAMHEPTGKVFAVGKEALRMIGKVPKEIRVVYPLREGVIADLDAAQHMFFAFFSRLTVHQHPLSSFMQEFQKPRAVVSIPFQATEVQRRALRSALISAGMGKIMFVEQAVASAIGAGLDIEKTDGRCVIDVGGATAEVAILSSSGVVVGSSFKIGGHALNQEFQQKMRELFEIVVGEQTSEQVKNTTGSVFARKNEKEQFVVVRGRQAKTNLPYSVKVSGAEIRGIFEPIVEQLAQEIFHVLKLCPPDLAGDILESGVIVVGGTARLRGIEAFLSSKLNIPVTIPDEPERACIHGCQLIAQQAKYKQWVRRRKGVVV